MTAKCNRCNKPIDREREAFVTIPNTERCGYQSRRPTSFAHANCFEKDVIFNYEERKNNEAAVQAAIRDAGRRA